MFTPTKNAFWASAKVLRCLIVVCFFFNLILPAQGFAQAVHGLGSGTMLQTPMFSPAMMIGMEIFPDNPFQFDFIVNGGDEKLEGDALKVESERMIRYFLASLTIPDQDLWVNLSPYEQDRILPDALAQTDLGRDLLAQDYVLKQFTSALINPDSDLGKRFWDRVYQKAFEMYQTTQIPIDTFNKVWIMPGKATVYRHGNMTFVSQASLKVMLEEDYVALQAKQQVDRREHVVSSEKPLLNTNDQILTIKNTLASDIVRDVILPELEKEVNTSKSFAALRQAYHALILGTWFKINLKESLLGKTYVNRSTVSGIDLEDKTVKQKIYESYVSAYKQGAYHFVRAEYDVHEQKHIARQYFSGGVVVGKELAEKIAEDQRPSHELEEKISSGINTRIQTALMTADPSLPATSSAMKIPVLPSTLAPKAVVEKLVGILGRESREVLVELTGKPLADTTEIYLNSLEDVDMPYVSGIQITFDDGSVMALSKKYINHKQGSVWLVDSFSDEMGEPIFVDQAIKIPSGIFMTAPKVVDALSGLNFRQAMRYLMDHYIISFEDIRISSDERTIVGSPDRGKSVFILKAQDQDWFFSSGSKGITPGLLEDDINKRLQRLGPVELTELDPKILELLEREMTYKPPFDLSTAQEGQNVYLDSDYSGTLSFAHMGLYSNRKGQIVLNNISIYVDEFGRVHKQMLEDNVEHDPKKFRDDALEENKFRLRVVKGLVELIKSKGFVNNRLKDDMMVRAYEGGDATTILSKVFGEEKTLKQLYADTQKFWGSFDFAVRLAEQIVSREQEENKILTEHDIGQMIFDLEQKSSFQIEEQRQRALSAETQPIEDYFFKFWNIPIPKRETFPSYRDLGSGQLFFDSHDKIYPLARNFFLMYGGEKEEYQFLRPLAEAMTDIDFFIGQTKDIFGDVDVENNQITINAQFFDFLAHTGYKKVALSFLAGLVAQLKPRTFSSKMTMKEMEILVGSSKKSLMIKDGSRLDEVKALYQLGQKVKDNERAQNPYYLTEDDILLFISNQLHRGKNLNSFTLTEKLTDYYGIYGEISEEEAKKILDIFQKKYSAIVQVSEFTLEDATEAAKAKLEPDANLIISASDAKDSVGSKVYFYGFTKEYMIDPAFEGRVTVWDIEVERQDELAFGGKTAHTGEMGYAPHVVTLANFASAGKTFQRPFTGVSVGEYLEQMEDIIKRIVEYRDSHRALLSQKDRSEEQTQKLINEMALLRVVLDPESDEDLISQISRNLEIMNTVSDDLTSGTYTNLQEYFDAQGKALDQAVRENRDRQKQVLLLLQQAEAEKQDDRISELYQEAQDLQLTYEGLTAKVTAKLLVAARMMVVPAEIREEIRRNLKMLAERMGIPLDKLVLAIRSSAVGEDSEAASFAGRQDTYIFVTPFASQEDEDGLDFIITNWIFNQASLFNKRAVDYRFDYGLPTFDEHVEISTLFQEMFLSQISFIGFSVNRETGFPAHTGSFTEGQGESLVSGQETGSEFISTYGGLLISRKKGSRENMIIETPDGLGKIRVEIPEELKKEFAITDHALLAQIARYFSILHNFYEDYVDLEGALRVKRDAEGKMITLKDEHGNVLLDERGFPRYDWMIVSTQARPETVWSQRDPHKIFMKQVSVTQKAFDQAQKQGKVLPFEFLAKTGGVAQGSIFWVLDKTPETFAKTPFRIMATYQSDPDMNSPMIAARGILAKKGGPNSHTMIVASEYGLVAITGTDSTMEELRNAMPDGTKITIDANRGKILIGTDHELQIDGKDFRPVDLPRTRGRMGVFAATVNSAFKVAPLREHIDSYGIGLHRLELTLTDKIGIYPELLLAYDNLMRKNRGESFEGPVLDPVKDGSFDIKEFKQAVRALTDSKLAESIVGDLYDYMLKEGFIEKFSFEGFSQKRARLLVSPGDFYAEVGKVFKTKKTEEDLALLVAPIMDILSKSYKIEYVRQAIEGYNSAEDYYISRLSEDISAISVTTIPPMKTVIMHAQRIKDPELRFQALQIVRAQYEQGFGQVAPVKALEQMLVERTQGQKDALVPGSDEGILDDLIRLLDKRHYIRTDDRKSDEYEAVYGSDEFIKREINPMKGKRGLDLMFSNPDTFRWQLRAIKKAARTQSAKIGVFAPVVRRPEDVVNFLEILWEEGLVEENIKVGIMTELPTNSINLEDFLMAVAIFENKNGLPIGTVDFFTSTGGNDGLQTLYRIDRNASNLALQKTATDESAGIFRWNARIASMTAKVNRLFADAGVKIKNAVCGNAASKYAYYAAALFKMGYDAVSTTPESSQTSYEYAKKGREVEIPSAAESAIGFDYEIDPKDLKSVKIISDHQARIGADFNLKLGFHHRVLKHYDDVLLPKVQSGETLTGNEKHMYETVRKTLSDAELSLLLDQPNIGMRFYQMKMIDWLRSHLENAQKNGQRLLVEMDAAFSNEYRDLPFGEEFEPEEANPEYGVHGPVKALQPEIDLDFFKEQLRAIKQVVDSQGSKDQVVFQMRAVRSPKEIKEILALTKEEGLDIPLVLDVEVGANLNEIAEILDRENKISEITIANPLQFTSDVMAMEINNINGNDITQKDQNYQMSRPMMILATAARKAGIPFSVDPSLNPRLQELIVQTQGLSIQNRDTGLVFYIDALTGNIVPTKETTQASSIVGLKENLDPAQAAETIAVFQAKVPAVRLSGSFKTPKVINSYVEKKLGRFEGIPIVKTRSKYTVTKEEFEDPQEELATVQYEYPQGTVLLTAPAKTSDFWGATFTASSSGITFSALSSPETVQRELMYKYRNAGWTTTKTFQQPNKVEILQVRKFGKRTITASRKQKGEEWKVTIVVSSSLKEKAESFKLSGSFENPRVINTYVFAGIGGYIGNPIISTKLGGTFESPSFEEKYSRDISTITYQYPEGKVTLTKPVSSEDFWGVTFTASSSLLGVRKGEVIIAPKGKIFDYLVAAYPEEGIPVIRTKLRVFESAVSGPSEDLASEVIWDSITRNSTEEVFSIQIDFGEKFGEKYVKLRPQFPNNHSSWQVTEVHGLEEGIEMPSIYKAHVVRKIHLIPRNERIERIEKAKYNLFNLKSRDVFIDFLTDSGTGAISDMQKAMSERNDESYSGGESYVRMKESVTEILDFPYLLPVHQGRAAENVINLTMITPEKNIVIGNPLFDTTTGHVLSKGGVIIEVPVKESAELDSEFPFKGNLDIDALRKALMENRGKVAYILATITDNMSGGQPVSLTNLKAVRALANEFGVPLFGDIARFAENAYFIKERDPGYQDKSMQDIVKEMMSVFDVVQMSAKKDGLTPMGGFIAMRSEEYKEKFTPFIIYHEGFLNYGGISGKDMEIIAEGFKEVVDESYLKERIGQSRYLGTLLHDAGVPVRWPIGGHGVFIDGYKFFDGRIPKEQFPAQVLGVALYEEGGIRGIEIGSLVKGRNPDGSQRKAAHEFLRLAIPRRTYSRDQLKYVADVIIKIYKSERKKEVPGLMVTKGLNNALMHFTAELAPVSSSGFKASEPIRSPINLSETAVSSTGGIDFATLYEDLEIEIDENGVPLPVQFQNVERIHIDRLTPFIMHMLPIPNLYFQLGLDQQDPDLADIARAGN